MHARPISEPAVRPLRQRRDAVHLFARKEIYDLATLWIALARAEKELGLPMTDEQMDELEAHLTDIDYDKAAAYEKKLSPRCHGTCLYLWAACPKAKRIIHLGATCCYVGDNTDVILMREAFSWCARKLVRRAGPR